MRKNKWSKAVLVAGQHEDLVQVGWNPIKAAGDAIKNVAMKICLAALDLVIGVLTAVKAVVDGIASVLIKALEVSSKTSSLKHYTPSCP